MTRPVRLPWLVWLTAPILFCSPLLTLEAAETLAGTQPLSMEGDIASELVDEVDRFLLGEIDKSVERRARHWRREPSSPEAYTKSLEPNRNRLAKMLGIRDPRIQFDGLELLATTSRPALVGRGQGFKVYEVRWPVIEGIHGEGLLLVPKIEQPLADAVCLPDAGQTPETLVGLAPGILPESQFARRLAESGCRVVVPLVINRENHLSVGMGGQRSTKITHREFLYRPSFELGRHLIGYELQKVLAVVDWFSRDAKQENPKIGVVGYGEGGLLALFAGALDPRIDAVGVSGAFDSRQNVWREPLDRNVFGLLDEFGGAELVSMVAPRACLIEAAAFPDVTISPGTEGGPGHLETPPLDEVSKEVERARQLVAGLVPSPSIELAVSDDGAGPFGTAAWIAGILRHLGNGATTLGSSPTNLRKEFDPSARLKRQFDEIKLHTQLLLAESPYVRADFMAKVNRSGDLEKYRKSIEPYREYFRNEVVGSFDYPLAKPNPRTRKVYDETKYTGYEVVLDVYPGVFAYGILLMPKDIPEGERRPVVVCQHGLEGRPRDTIETDIPGYRHYKAFAAQLAEKGYVTFAPQNIYIFGDRFRTLQRKANAVKKTLFSVMAPQHQQIVHWLGSLPQVDPERIGFYGLSYGGKSAMRIPALVDGYALSICSADFNEWVWKNADIRNPYSYAYRGEYEIFEFDLGSTFNYAEMAALICPRPFMVERGHRDGVAPDEAVAYEYAKVRLLYVDLKIPERTKIEFFDGPHSINAVGTFDFLDRHLRGR